MMPRPMIRCDSPNIDTRSGEIDILLMHYTGMTSALAAVERLCDPLARVSAHYVVDEAGQIYQLADESARCWHAGISHWRGLPDVNSRSIGIEIANPGHEHGYVPFPDAQMRSVIALSQAILARWPIPARNVIGHSDIAPSRKEDPGELFDWARLAVAGIGLWPFGAVADRSIVPLGRGDSGSAVLTLQQDLARYGWPCPAHGRFDAETEKTVVAFQRHFRQSPLNGRFDAQCRARLDALLASC
jgi:N-acetylmuramoyl-L-alanine amidase